MATWRTGDRVARHGTVSFERSGIVRVRWDDGETTEIWAADLARSEQPVPSRDPHTLAARDQEWPSP
jgi:hypothetical protein